jgi:hypothetical protein
VRLWLLRGLMPPDAMRSSASKKTSSPTGWTPAQTHHPARLQQRSSQCNACQGTRTLACSLITAAPLTRDAAGQESILGAALPNQQILNFQRPQRGVHCRRGTPQDAEVQGSAAGKGRSQVLSSTMACQPGQVAP